MGPATRARRLPVAFERPAWPASWPRSAAHAKRQRAAGTMQGLPGFMSCANKAASPEEVEAAEAAEGSASAEGGAGSRSLGVSEAEAPAEPTPFGRGPAPVAETPEAATSPAPGSTPGRERMALRCFPHRPLAVLKECPKKRRCSPQLRPPQLLPTLQRLTHGRQSWRLEHRPSHRRSLCSPLQALQPLASSPASRPKL